MRWNTTHVLNSSCTLNGKNSAQIRPFLYGNRGSRTHTHTARTHTNKHNTHTQTRTDTVDARPFVSNPFCFLQQRSSGRSFNFVCHSATKAGHPIHNSLRKKHCIVIAQCARAQAHEEVKRASHTHTRTHVQSHTDTNTQTDLQTHSYTRTATHKHAHAHT